MMKMNLGIAAAVAALFAAGCGSDEEEAVTADGDELVRCEGINECAGQSECASEGGNSCEGQNECAGQGWITVTRDECATEGGTEVAT